MSPRQGCLVSLYILRRAKVGGKMHRRQQPATGASSLRARFGRYRRMHDGYAVSGGVEQPRGGVRDVIPSRQNY